MIPINSRLVGWLFGLLVWLVRWSFYETRSRETLVKNTIILVLQTKGGLNAVLQKYILKYSNRNKLRHAVAQLVAALRYKPESRGFDSRWCHWSFSLT